MVKSEALRHVEKLHFKRELRRNLTPAENILWQELRGRKLMGTKWRRQENIDHFIADFLCKEHKLIIEVDGDIHEKQHEYDRLRTEVINVHRYRVIRFQNEEVFEQLPRVLQKISEAMTILKTPESRVTPSPVHGEGAGG